jgi:hypothetical protein
MNDDEILDTARQCARKLVEHGIAVITQGDDLHFLWDLCPEVWEQVKHDIDLMDAIRSMVAIELSEVRVSCLLRGETAKDGERRRVMIERMRAKAELNTAQDRYDRLTARLAQLGGVE